MELNQVAVVAAFGAVAAFWNQARSFITKFFSIFVRSDTITYSQSLGLMRKISPDLKIFKWGNRTFQRHDVYVDEVCLDLYSSYVKSYLCRYKNTLILLTSPSDCQITITYIAGTFDLSKLMAEVNNDYNNDARQSQRDKRAKRLYAQYHVVEVFGNDYSSMRDSKYRNESNDSPTLTSKGTASLGSSSGGSSTIFSEVRFLAEKGDYYGLSWDAAMKTTSRPLAVENYYWSKEALKLDQEITFWLNNKSWYLDRGLQWKRGALLKGIPGTGKTKMVLACAKKHRLRVARFSIGTMSDNEFNKFLAEYAEHQQETLILIEDIDCVFENRVNILAGDSMGKQLMSFDTLINGLCGVKGNINAFFVVTTNRVEVLDAALLRAGRLDVHIEVPKLVKEGKQLLATNILRDWPNLVEELVDKCEEYTAAEFENLCIETAIAEKNKEANVELNRDQNEH